MASQLEKLVASQPEALKAHIDALLLEGVVVVDGPSKLDLMNAQFCFTERKAGREVHFVFLLEGKIRTNVSVSVYSSESVDSEGEIFRINDQSGSRMRLEVQYNVRTRRGSMLSRKVG